MAEGEQQRRLAFEHRLDLRRHVVDAGGELREFALAAGRDGLGEMAAADLLDLRRNLPDRLKHAPDREVECEKDAAEDQEQRPVTALRTPVKVPVEREQVIMSAAPHQQYLVVTPMADEDVLVGRRRRLQRVASARPQPRARRPVQPAALDANFDRQRVGERLRDREIRRLADVGNQVLDVPLEIRQDVVLQMRLEAPGEARRNHDC